MGYKNQEKNLVQLFILSEFSPTVLIEKSPTKLHFSHEANDKVCFFNHDKYATKTTINHPAL